MIDDCLSEGQVGQFHWRCKADEVEEQLIVLLDQQLTATAHTKTLTIYELHIAGATSLAEFNLVAEESGLIDLDPAQYDAFLDFCRGLQTTNKQLREEKENDGNS